MKCEHEMFKHSPDEKCNICRPKLEKKAPVNSKDLLYGAVMWLNKHPLLDGMKYFKNKEDCIRYADSQESFGFDVEWTIIRLEKGNA